MNLTTGEVLNHLGVKATPEQLRETLLPALYPTAEASFGQFGLPDPQFPFEVHTFPRDFADEKATTLLTDEILRTIEAFPPSRVSVHCPLDNKGMPINLCRPADCEQTTFSLRLLEQMVDIGSAITAKTEVPVIFTIHGYHLPNETPEDERDTAVAELEMTLGNAIANLRSLDRPLDGIALETMAYGPFSLASAFNTIFREIRVPTVCDASHLFRAYVLGEDGELVSRYGQDTDILLLDIDRYLMGGEIAHWHCCQCAGLPAHTDDPLCFGGAMDWQKISKRVARTIAKHRATGIVEVNWRYDVGDPSYATSSWLGLAGMVLRELGLPA